MTGIDVDLKIYATAGLAIFFVILLALGFVAPLRTSTRSPLKRYVVNALFSIMSFVAGMLIVAPVALYLMGWAQGASFGLLNWIDLPMWAEFIIGFLLLDLSFYYWHRINHEVPLLWRFHNVHHVDPDVDVTTSFRFHFVEIAYSSVFRAVQVLIIGPFAILFVVYEIVFQAGTLFHHSNVRLPVGIERIINYVFVTPRMHGIHHSAVRDETNSNYSVVLRWWDWLNRSLRLNVPQSAVTIGVTNYRGEEDNGFWNLVVMPFVKQRDYWQGADGERKLTRRDKPGKPTRMVE